MGFSCKFSLKPTHCYTSVRVKVTCEPQHTPGHRQGLIQLGQLFQGFHGVVQGPAWNFEKKRDMIYSYSKQQPKLGLVCSQNYGIFGAKQVGIRLSFLCTFLHISCKKGDGSNCLNCQNRCERIISCSEEARAEYPRAIGNPKNLQLTSCVHFQSWVCQKVKPQNCYLWIRKMTQNHDYPLDFGVFS